MARLFGDRTAELLGRLSLNPMRHIDLLGTLCVPAVLLAIGGPLIGWAKPVPVAIGAMRFPRRAMICVAAAGPAANLLMALTWCGLWGAISPVNPSQTPMRWIALMCQAGIFVNVVLAVFNLLPVPPLDGGRILAGLLPPRFGSRLEKVEPFGLFLVLGLSLMRWLDWIFEPAFRVMGRVISALLGPAV